jgi:hypothetical protein
MMQSRISPDGPGVPPRQSAAQAAMITASYAPDFERCRLLCETMDRHVSGHTKHYILVEGRDVALFRQLESSHRHVVDERDLLPSWLRSYWDPFSLFRKRIWLSLRAKPLRGWHVQQLRRIAIATHLDEEALVFCDSDVAFIRPFDLSVFVRDDKVRLFRRDDEVEKLTFEGHRHWHRNAADLLAIAEPKVSPHDYISTLIAWRRETVNEMCRHIEKVNGTSWVEAIASERRFSECTIYGRYVDEVTGGAKHFLGREEYCHIQWFGTPHSDDELRAFIDTISLEQVAIGMQSFIGTDIGRLRRLIAAWDGGAA